jgi:hypothetical protein
MRYNYFLKLIEWSTDTCTSTNNFFDIKLFVIEGFAMSLFDFHKGKIEYNCHPKNFFYESFHAESIWKRFDYNWDEKHGKRVGDILSKHRNFYVERPEMIVETNFHDTPQYMTNYEFSIKDRPRLYILATDVEMQRLNKWSFGQKLSKIYLYHLNPSELDLAQDTVAEHHGLVEPDPIYTETVEYNSIPESQLMWSESDQCIVVTPMVLLDDFQPEIKVTKALTWLSAPYFNYQ